MGIERPAVNFTNVKWTNFLYECWYWQLFSSYMYVAEMTFVQKIRTFNVDEIDTRAWFHQHVYAQLLRAYPKSAKKYSQVVNLFYAFAFMGSARLKALPKMLEK